MAEKTEVEKAQERFEQKFAEQRSQNDHQFQVAMKIQDVRYTELRESFEERKKELLAQNDGLLGAVGRLHAENEVLRKRIPELEANLQRFQHEMISKEERLKIEREIARVESKREIDQVKAETKAQISELDAMLEKARNRKPQKK